VHRSSRAAHRGRPLRLKVVQTKQQIKVTGQGFTNGRYQFG
jgi:hypothetical protein